MQAPGMKGNRDPRLRLLSLVFVAGLLLLVYGPVVMANYAKVDTFGVFANVFFGRFATFTSWTAIQGRPIASVAISMVFGMIDSLDGLRGARAIGLLGTVLLGLVLARVLGRLGRRPVEAAALAIGITCIPGITTITAWTVCFPYPWAAALAVWGGWAGVSAAEKGDWRHALAAAIALQAALWTYQPSALYALVPMAVAILAGPDRLAAAMRQGLAPIALLAANLGLYFVIYKGLFLRLMPPINEAMQARLQPASDLPAKLGLLVGRALPESLAGWAWFVSDMAASISIWGLLILAGAGLVQPLHRLGKGVLLVRGMLLAVLVLFSLIPVLYLSGGAPYYRIMGPFTALVVLGVVISCFSLCPRRRIGPAIATGLVLLQAFAAGWVLRTHWVRPAAAELETYRSWFSENAGDPRPSALVLTPSQAWIYDGLRRRYLYGFISTNQYWVMDPMVRLLLAETHDRAYAGIVPIYQSGREPGQLDDQALRVDANRILAPAGKD